MLERYRARAVREQALAGSEHDRKDHQVKFVDEIERGPFVAEGDTDS